MNISHNEIVVACLKAFEALGLPQGQREDAADAIGWLALHGLPFEQKLADRLVDFRPDALKADLVSQTATSSVWDAEGSSALVVFPNLADFAFVKAQLAGRHRLTVTECPDIDLIWPYLKNFAHQRRWIECHWRLAENEEVLVDYRQDGGRIYHFQKQHTLQPHEIELVINLEESVAVRQINDVILHVETEQDWFQEKLNRTQNGIPIDSRLWQTLDAIGKGILVEATEESELRGAGGV
ncbi:MAG: DUF3726 domain-containing protein [Chloroflexota bacterium]